MTKPKWRTLVLCSVITQITAMTTLESKVNELYSNNDGVVDTLNVYPYDMHSLSILYQLLSKLKIMILEVKTSRFLTPRKRILSGQNYRYAINRPIDVWGESPVDGIYNDNDEDGISDGLDEHPFDSSKQ
ncbi:hypothetical protein ACE1OE_09485 [Vibrio sp. E150_011]